MAIGFQNEYSKTVNIVLLLLLLFLHYEEWIYYIISYINHHKEFR